MLNTETGEWQATLHGHTDTVFALVVSEGRLLSGSYDETICVWSLATLQCTRTVQAGGIVGGMVMHDGKLIAGVGRTMIKVWDAETWELQHTVQGVTSVAVLLLSFL